MKKIQELILRFIEISSPDPDDMRRRKNLNIIILGLTSLLLIEIPISIFNLTNLETNDSLIITAGSLFMLLSMIGIYYVNRHKAGSLSAYIFLVAITLVISFSDTPEQLANGRSLFIFIVPIVMASLMLEANTTFIFAAISSLIISAIALSIGQSPNSTAILSYFLVALLSWMTSSSLQNTLKDLRLINTNLDKLVLERTNELTDVLNRERIDAGRSQAILNSIADGVVVFNQQNSIILTNPAITKLTESRAEQFNNKDLKEFVNSAGLTQESQKTMSRLFEHPEQSLLGSRIEWGKRFLSTSIAPVKDLRTGERMGSVAVFRDITQEIQLEKMKESFVAVISHELRTPLNAILGHVEIMKEGVYGSLNEKQAAVTERIMVNVNRMLNMVAELLDEAQMRAGKLSIKPQVIETASLLENLHSSMDRYATNKGLYIVSELNSEMPRQVVGDPQRLHQILNNLVGNAVKFTESGIIKVTIDRIGTNKWKMEVIDNGVGIPENELPYIFDTFRQANNMEFTTRKYGGFGLGLSIVKQLIELMHGEIHVRSETGKGSTFSVTLPLKTDLNQERK